MSFAFAHPNKTGDSKKSTLPEHSSYSPHINNLKAKESPNTILYLQRAIGNQEVQSLINSDKEVGFDFAKIGILQPKLKVSQPNDVYEQEADKVAEQVMRMTDPSESAMSEGATKDEERITRKCAGCKMKEEEGEEDDKKLQISRMSSTTTTDASILEANDKTTNEIDNIRSSGGSSLDSNTGEFMKSRFGGYDFSNVRIHADRRAATLAQSVNALAYTVGNDIVFGQGRYQPDTLQGRKLLAHELTHVVQQSGSGANRFGQSDGKRELYSISRRYMAPSALLTGRISSISTTSDAWVQRSPDEPILGAAAGSTSETIVLYHYGNLEGVESFKSPPGYPRLTDCDIATSQGEAYEYTRTPITENLQYKYELKIDRAYFEKNFRNMGSKGAYSEFGTKDPIPVKYFRNVLKLTPAPVTPQARMASGDITVTPPGGSTSGGLTKTAAPTAGEKLGPKPQTKPPSTAKRIEPIASKGAPLKAVGEETPGLELGAGSVSQIQSPTATTAKAAVNSAEKEAAVFSVNQMNKEMQLALSWEKAIRWVKLGLQVWNAYNVLDEASKAVHMSIAILAKGSPYSKEIDHAKAIEKEAKTFEENFSSFDIRPQLKSLEASPDWDDVGGWTIHEFYMEYYIAEMQLSEAMELVKEVMDNLDDQIKSLAEAVNDMALAAVLLPVTSLKFAEAYFFSDAAAQMLRSLSAAKDSYYATLNSMTFSRSMLRAALKHLELRNAILEKRDAWDKEHNSGIYQKD